MQGTVTQHWRPEGLRLGPHHQCQHILTHYPRGPAGKPHQERPGRFSENQPTRTNDPTVLCPYLPLRKENPVHKKPWRGQLLDLFLAAPTGHSSWAPKKRTWGESTGVEHTHPHVAHSGSVPRTTWSPEYHWVSLEAPGHTRVGNPRHPGHHNMAFSDPHTEPPAILFAKNC